MKAFQTCPFLWYEKYEKHVELDWAKKGVTATDFGKRVHELLELHYLDMKGTPHEPYPEHQHEPTELEAQLTLAAYVNNYPVEHFTIVDVEKTFRVPLGTQVRCKQCGTCYDLPSNDACQICNHRGYEPRHEYTGKMDIVFRDNATGALGIMDHKSEKRTAQSNNPKAWASRTQGTLYIWAARQLYGEPVSQLIVNILRRQSDKGQVGCEFRRDTIERNPDQIESAVRGLVMVADQIEDYKARFCEQDWADAANRNNCMNGNFACDFFDPHLMGWSDELLRNYRPTVPYLDL